MFTEIIKIPGSKKKTRVIQFNSSYEFVNLKETDSRCAEDFKKCVADRFNQKSGESAKRWFGCETLPEYLDIMERGAPEFTKMLISGNVDIKPARSIKRKRVKSDYGDELDIHAVNRGDLSTAWTRRGARVVSGARNVRLLVNIGLSSDKTSKQAQWRGIAALSIAETLVNAGYNVAIDIIAAGDGVTDKENNFCAVPIKDYQAPLDIASLAAATCFVGYMRGAGFYSMVLCDGVLSGGRGCPTSDADIIEKFIPAYYKDASEKVLLISRDVLSESDARKCINKTLENVQGVLNAVA